MDTKKEFLKLRKKLVTEELHANVKKSIIRAVNEVAPKAFGNSGQIQVTTGIEKYHGRMPVIVYPSLDNLQLKEVRSY